jgi:hypothetical protein
LILLAKENNLLPEKISKLTGIELDKINYIFDLVKYSHHLIGNGKA